MNLSFFFSVLIAKQRPFIGVVGIQHIVLLNANKTIGTENTNECVEEKGDPNLNLPPLPTTTTPSAFWFTPNTREETSPFFIIIITCMYIW